MNALNILKAAFFTPLLPRPGSDEIPWGLTLLFWGPPGCGKSYRIKALCQKWGLYAKVLSPGTDGEGAFGVTPVPEGKVISYPPPYWAADVVGGGVVFLDEVNQAVPTLQPAIMGIALDGRIGDHVLDAKVRRVAAANPPKMAAGGWPLAPPVANRFGHMEWPLPDADEWTDWLLDVVLKDDTQFDATKEEARVLEAWPVPWATASGLITGFIKARPELLFKMPPPGDENASKAWPSHRTWEMSTRAMASSDVHGLSQLERETFIGAFVSEAVASELMGYIEKMDLPNPEDVLDGKVKFKHDPHRLDRTAAILTSCATLIAPSSAKSRRPRAAKLWGILSDKALLDDAMDVGFTAAKRLVMGKLHTMKEAYPVLAKMLPILEEVGIKFDPNKAKSAGSGYEDED